ncbi:GNAT family N-acetyltransferase [Oscillatoria sp. FACHB-1406]|uniref:GNAT family N-acetyltransferase n=1 Tax=Oscillatoria sp. FACHB-1406 TaxID=2692846 RepID=UPI0016861BCF|nr:GNAT family N-acetyltransferase [Oscillatoria sp. FACHB-1406]MBD2578990.1 GNAT family N-acetyltransferase [Oscillatoria sp. FACHB-1406]
MNIEIFPCSIHHLETLIEGKKAFQAAYHLDAIEGYMPFEGALEYILKQMKDSQIWHPWLPYLFVFSPDRALVGLGGFKSVPDPQRSVEIGYSIAPSYQGRGFATSAAKKLIEIAFESQLVDRVFAHTLAEPNASTRVLEKCGMTQVAEAFEPDIGKVWRWEIERV